MEQKHRFLWLGIRQGLLIILGAIEEFLGLERSIIPKHLREDKQK